MKKQFLILSMSCLFGISSVNGQQADTALKSRYEREALMLGANQNKYRKGKAWKKIGLFKSRIEQEFAGASPESKQELKSFRRQRKRGSVLLIAGGVLFVSAAIVAPIITLPVFAAGFGVGLTTYLVGAVDLQHSRQHLNEAVWLRNRDAMAVQ